MRSIASAAWGSSPSLAKDARTPLTIEDLYRIEGPQALRLAPDGRTAVFVRQWIDPKTKQERTPSGSSRATREKARPLEPGEPDARAPVFSPDGKWIAFLSTRPRPEGWKQTPPVPPESDPATDLWLIPADGRHGDPARRAGQALRPRLQRRLLRPARLLARRQAARLRRRRRHRPAHARGDRATTSQVVRPDQGEGYTGYGPAQVWVAHLDAKPGKFAATRIDRLTDDDVWYGDPQWSPDGKIARRPRQPTDDRESVRFSINKNFDLWAIDVATRQAPAADHRARAGGVAALLAGRQAARLPERPAQGLAPRRVQPGRRHARRRASRDAAVLFDHHGPSADEPPHPPPAFPLPDDCWDGDDAPGLQRRASAPSTARSGVDLATGKGSRCDAGDEGRAGRRRRGGRRAGSS